MDKSGYIKLWLVNCTPGNQYYWGEGTMFAVGNYLKNYFTQACQHKNSKIATADFSWERGSVQAHDLVIYFLPSIKSSFISNTFKAQPKHTSGSGGTFPSPSGMITEVYLDAMEGDNAYSRLVAKLAFHECMHNKIDASTPATVADIHGKAGGGGLASANISNGTDLTPENIALMAQVLDKAVPQYTDEMNARTKFLL